jgi:hypothetical protein
VSFPALKPLHDRPINHPITMSYNVSTLTLGQTMTRKEQLITAIEQSSDAVIEQLWQTLKTLPPQTSNPVTIEPPTVLERMGIPPQHFLNDGTLSDRANRKAAIAQHIQQRQTDRS